MKSRLPISVFCFLFSVFCCAAQTVRLEWSPPTNAAATLNYQVHLGTNSRAYFTNWPVAGTNTTIALTNLWPGTNYLAVTAVEFLNGTNSLQSDYSNEVIIRRAGPPNLRLTAWLFSGPAPGDWTERRELACLDVPADGPHQFFAANLTTQLIP